MYIMYRVSKNTITFAPLYKLSLPFMVAHDYKECETYNLIVSGPQDLEHIKDKLRYYRLKKSLHQSEIAQYAGIDRVTYIAYEQGIKYYPYSTMQKISECLGVPLDTLIDDYHRFVYFNQGENIKKVRKAMGNIKQDELAELMGVKIHVIKAAEREKVRLLKKNYNILMELYEKYVVSKTA